MFERYNENCKAEERFDMKENRVNQKSNFIELPLFLDRFKEFSQQIERHKISHHKAIISFLRKRLHCCQI